jgi:hypothetical protein
VDAVTRALVLLWRILFYRPLIVVVLLLFYSVAALLLVTVESHKKGLALALIAAFAAAGLSAILTERISRYSLQASMIGLPDHARVMRRVQGCSLVLFVAAPTALACVFGANPLAALAALAVATAVGVALAAYGGLWIVLVLLLGKVLPLEAWAELAPVQALATGVSGYLIWRWFELPQKMERGGILARAQLADATHERIERTGESEDSATAGEHGAVPPDNRLVNAVTADLDSGRHLSAVLAIGFGYSVGITWRAVLYGAGISIAVLAAWSVLHGSKPTVLAYGIVTAVCCFGVVGRLQGLLQQWMRTSTEQALLQLAPRWPESRRIKRAVVASTILVQRGSITVWIASSAAAALLGWIGSVELLWGVVAVLGASLAFSGAAWAVLAHRRIREWHLTTIAIVLTVCAGAVTVLFGASIAIGSWMVGVAMMLVPPALALAAYFLMPLRFPLEVDARVLKGRE